MQFDVSISTKGQLVLPKEIRDKFQLNVGSKLRVFVENERIVLQPRSFEKDVRDFIFSAIRQDGKKVNGDTLQEYQAKFRKAIDQMVAEAEAEYQAGEYISLGDLKRELLNERASGPSFGGAVSEKVGSAS